jgi:hypothetical protein
MSLDLIRIPKKNPDEGLFSFEVDAAIPTVEEQGRGVLHTHILIWLNGWGKLYEDLGNLDPNKRSVAEVQLKMFAKSITNDKATLLLLLTHGLESFKLLYGLCRYSLSAFVPPRLYQIFRRIVGDGRQKNKYVSEY